MSLKKTQTQTHDKDQVFKKKKPVSIVNKIESKKHNKKIPQSIENNQYQNQSTKERQTVKSSNPITKHKIKDHQKKRSRSPETIVSNLEKSKVSSNKDTKGYYLNYNNNKNKTRKTEENYYSSTSDNEFSESRRHTSTNSRDGSRKLNKTFFGNSNSSSNERKCKMLKNSKDEKKVLRAKLVKFRESIQERLKNHVKNSTNSVSINNTDNTPATKKLNDSV